MDDYGLVVNRLVSAKHGRRDCILAAKIAKPCKYNKLVKAR